MACNVTLHIYWSDGATVELRYFPNKRCAEQFVKHNGIVNYLID